MIPNLKNQAVTGDTPTALIDPTLIKAPSSTTNSAAQRAGWSILIIADADFHLGNSSMTRSNTDPIPAGSWQLQFDDGEVPYVLSTATGVTVTFKRIVQGLK